MVQFLTEYSLWWLVPFLLVGFLYAFLLYKKDAPWSKTINRVLFGFRWVLVTAICFLLLGPYSKLVKNYVENPTIVFAIDNSQSLPLVNKTEVLEAALGEIGDLAKSLQEKDIDIEIKALSEQATIDSLTKIPFSSASTDLSGMLRSIQNQYENKNLASVVLLSDGIYNQGISPSYTIGVGDTLPQVDVN